MLPQRNGLSLQAPLKTLSVLLVHLLLTHSCRGQSQLIGPPQPIVAEIGEDVILPCHLDPAVDVAAMTLEWTRSDLSPIFVHVRRAGQEVVLTKHPSYRERTSLSVDELKRGNISLKLSDVKPSDQGTYQCYIPKLDKRSSVELVVGAVSSPVIDLAGINRDKRGVMLDCKSKGWSPEPEVFWLDGEGNLLSAGPTETVRSPDDLYTVSSRATVEKRHSNSFTCRVQQKNINQTRETQIHVPDDFFPDPSSSGSGSSAPSSTIIGSVVGILFILAVAAVVLVWKWRQNKIRNKKHHEDEEKPNVREKKEINSTSNSSEQESLMDKEADREQLTTERETVNNPDKFKEETQTDGETQQRESNSVRIQTPGRVENHSVDKGTELQYSVEGKRHTDQRLAEGETETGEEETKQTNERRDAPNPAESNTEQQQEKRQTENNLQTEEGQEEIKTTGDKTQVQCLMEEEKHGEQLTAGRERENDVDKENETVVRKLNTKKERELKEFEKKASRLEGQMKQKEEQIKELKLQLEEVERQRKETQMKIDSVTCKLEEDKEEEEAEEEKDEAAKRLSDTMNDLNKKKAELQKELKKRETHLEGMKKEEMVIREKIKSLTVSQERTENLTDPVDSLTHKLTNVKL